MLHTHFQKYRNVLALVPLALLAAGASFGLGVGTAGELRAIKASSATETVRGDMNADGEVDARDAIIILEIAQGYRDPTPSELAADPNANGALAVDDAIRVLRSISPR